MNVFYCLELFGKHLIAGFIAIFVINFSAHAENVILRHSFAGNISFELTGNTLRDASNTCLPISGGQSFGSISLPSNATIKAAYLYWSGSGTSDNQVSLNGQTVTSQWSYTETFDGRAYFSEKADVTSLVSNTSTSYRVSGLTFNGTNTYCRTEGAYAGWALGIIFEHSAEPLRVVNVFDGFKNFWGSQFVLIPNNFIIADDPAGKKGKHAHITWEGDANNSQSRNNFTESLQFENINLTDGNNPSNNQFNGFSNVVGTATSGVDIDEYQIGNLLRAGDTSVHTRYSSGQDAVFLTAEFISVPNEPVADLSIQQSGLTNIVRSGPNTINFTVTNKGPNIASSNTQVTLPLPEGLSFNSVAGNQWNCSEAAREITCNYLNTIAKNASASSLSITFTAANATANSVSLSATVTGIKFDNILSNNTHSQTYNVISADLSNSKKTVIDLNGGNVQAGDTLRYTIDLIETNGVSISGITLKDNLPSNISSFNVISIPTGANNNSQPSPAGNNSAGLVSISNIAIAANTTASIIIDATISSSTPTNTAITNTAIISSTGVADINIDSATIYISKPANPASGNKPLYLRQTSNLSRIQPTSSAYNTLADLAEKTYVINPAFQQEFQFSDSTVSAYLFLQNSYTSRSWPHSVTVTLLHNNQAIGNVQRDITVPSRGVNGNNVALFEFSIPLSNTPVINTGDTLALKVFNNSTYDEDSLRIYSIDPNPNASDSVSPYSLVSLPAATVINVDQISIIKDTQKITEASPSDDIIIQAEVSDPFGSFDIRAANISIKDSQGDEVIVQQAMSVLSDSSNAKKTFQFSYNLPADATLGDWKISVTAFEGVENEIDHTSDSILKITALLPNITITKTVDVFSDPVHGENSNNNFSKALPGAILTYTVTAINTGPGIAQNNSIWISDVVPTHTFLTVSDFDGIAGTGPISQQSNASPSGLNYNFNSLASTTDDIEFSNTNGSNFDYSPVADSDGIDKNITHFRINPKGIFQAPVAGESPTQFTIKFRVRLQ